MLPGTCRSAGLDEASQGSTIDGKLEDRGAEGGDGLDPGGKSIGSVGLNNDLLLPNIDTGGEIAVDDHHIAGAAGVIAAGDRCIGIPVMGAGADEIFSFGLVDGIETIGRSESGIAIAEISVHDEVSARNLGGKIVFGGG